MYKELTSVGVYMLIYTPWNSFDVWLHHSIYIYIYIYIIYIYIYVYIYIYIKYKKGVGIAIKK